MANTYYSIVRDGIHVFDNVKNRACYATIFTSYAYGGTVKFEDYIKPNSFFELYIPVSEFAGSFIKKTDAKKYIESVKKMGFKFEYKFETQLPRKIGAGWRISFDINKCSKIEIKVATYLIRFMWEVLPKNFDKYYLEILKRYGSKISNFSLLKYAYYNFKFFNPGCYYLGHYLSHDYAIRCYEDNLTQLLKSDFESVFSRMFRSDIYTKYVYPFLKENNPHIPQTLQDSIDNLEKYIKNPHKELDK